VTDVSVGTENGEELSIRHDVSFYNCKHVNRRKNISLEHKHLMRW
jgi:hypothetical protein